MKVAVFYFSGTGNTEKVVKEWQKNALDLGIEFDLFKIEKDEFDFSKINDYDKIGFGYPIHAFNAPENVWKYCKKFPKLETPKKCFVLMCSGEYMNLNHSSYKKMNKILKKKNYIIECDHHYIMPYNMIFRHTEIRAYKMYETMKKLAPIDVKEYLVDGVTYHTKKHHLDGWFNFLLRIEQWFSGVNGKFFKVNTKKCIKCMKCVNNCPTQNIKFVDGKFKFDNKCLLCTRCSFNCPIDAFSIALLNGWRVNKPYAFKDPGVEEKDKHPLYCKNSYKRYYREAEQRIAQYSK